MDRAGAGYYNRRESISHSFSANRSRSADTRRDGMNRRSLTQESPQTSISRAEHLRQHFEIEKQAAALGKPPLGRAERRCHRCFTNVPIRSSHCWGCGIVLPHGPSRKRNKGQTAPRNKAQQDLSSEADSEAIQGIAVNQLSNIQNPEDKMNVETDEPSHLDEIKPEERTTSTRGRIRAPRLHLEQGATEAELAAIEEHDQSQESSDDGRSKTKQPRRSTGRNTSGVIPYDGPPKKHTQKACPSCGEIQGVAAKFCRECEYPFPIGARRAAKEAVAPPVHEIYHFEPEYDEDGLPRMEKILGRRLIGANSSEKSDGKYVPATSTILLKFAHRAGESGQNIVHTRYDYEYLVKYKGVSYKCLQWLTASDIEARGKTARTALNRLVRKEEARIIPLSIDEDEEYFDSMYCEAERVLDVRMFDEEIELEDEEVIRIEGSEDAAATKRAEAAARENAMLHAAKELSSVAIPMDVSGPSRTNTMTTATVPSIALSDAGDGKSIVHSAISSSIVEVKEKMSSIDTLTAATVSQEISNENEDISTEGGDEGTSVGRIRTKEEQLWRPFTRCMRVLEKLEENPWVEIFLQPVDIRTFPKYLDVVESPMDLGTIRQRLENWKYRRNVPDDFARDVRLVWHNCKVFNKHGSSIWYTADYMAKHFERLYAAWVTNFSDKSIPFEDPLAQPWEQSCRICLSDEENMSTCGELLLCDCCDAEYHTRCLTPPLDSIPNELWQCPRCQIRLAAGGMLHSHALEEVARARAERFEDGEDRILRKTVKVQKYLVKWRGLSYRDCTWETKETINDDEVIEKYHKLNDIPPAEPNLTREELLREINPRLFNQLPAVRAPDKICELDSHIYSQLRAYHYLRFNQMPSPDLFRECGWATTLLADDITAMENGAETGISSSSILSLGRARAAYSVPAQEENDTEVVLAVLKGIVDAVSEATEAVIREEVKKVLYDAVVSVAEGTPHAPDYGPLLPCEYEVTVPKINNSLFMNIAEESGRVRVDTFRALPDGSDPPVRRGGRVQPLHYIVSINGIPCDKSGFEATITRLRTAPTYVTLRLCADLNLRNKLAADRDTKLNRAAQLEADLPKKGIRKDVPLWPSTLPISDAPIDPVSDSDSEDDVQPEKETNLRQAMESMGPKRKLLLAISEIGEPPCEEDYAFDIYRPEEIVQAMAGSFGSATTQRTKPIEQIDMRTGEIVRVWDSMTAAYRNLGISLSSISCCIRGRTEHAGGYRWRHSTMEAVTAWQKEQAAKRQESKFMEVKSGPLSRAEIQQQKAEIAAQNIVVAALRRKATDEAEEQAALKSIEKEGEDENLPWQTLLPKAGGYFKGNVLRDYQLEGVRWMLSCWYRKRSCILADEMGLGKTVQVTAVLEHIFSIDGIKGPFLVVVPLSTIEHWRREIEGWTDMELCVYHDVGGGRDMRDVIREYEWYYKGRSRNVIKFHVLLTTYDDMIRDFEELSEIPWRSVVVDEAHRLRNLNSRLLECLRAVMSRGNAMHEFQHRILMTGTPLQNNMEELWSLMNFIQPDKFGDRVKFLERYGAMETEEQVRSLQRRLAPHMLRRVKEDVASDIPPKEETVVDVELTLLQKQYYRAIFEKNHSILYKVSASSASGSASIPSLMNIQMELRKCCNHPYLVRGVEDHEVAQMLSALQLAKGKAGEAELARERLQKGLVQSSGKMVLLDKLLAKLKREGHKVLLFSQFISMLDIIGEYCSLSGIHHERLDGRITGNERQRAIDRFNRDPNSFLFLLSTRAGGVGINLTAADVCIIFDSDWNPQNDVQAMARCHRIGQTKKVAIYRLVTRGSFESEMFARASRKLGLEQAVLGNTAQKNDKMSTAELELLLREGAYAMLEGDEAMEEFNAMDIDSILQQRTRVITTAEDVRDKRTADWLSKKGVDAAALEEEELALKARQRRRGVVRKQKFSGETGGENIVEVDDPLFWQKVMPDLVTPTTILARLEEGEPALSRAASKTFMRDVEKMVSGISGSRAKGTHDFNELQVALRALTQIIGASDVFTSDQRSSASNMLLHLEGSRLRKSNRGDAGQDEYSDGGRASLRRRKALPSSPIPARRSSGSAKSGKRIASSPVSTVFGGRDFNMDLCCICEEGGEILLCDGPCNRSFHAPCLQLQRIPVGDQWVCPDCTAEVHTCLICGTSGPLEGNTPESAVHKCTLPACGRYYHVACLREDGRARFLPDKHGSHGGISFRCPQHYCRVCNKSSVEVPNKSIIVKCIRCPNGYHESCVKKTKFIRKGKMIICEDHIIESSAEKDSLKEKNETTRTSSKLHNRARAAASVDVPDAQYTNDYSYPNTEKEPKCKFCRGSGDAEETSEGPLIRPPFIDVNQGREVPLWAHRSCVLYSPECYAEKIDNEEEEDKYIYYNVIKARRRGRCIRCAGCSLTGATIGCHVESCKSSFHFSCALATGWEFGEFPDGEGKIFRCEQHREGDFQDATLDTEQEESDQSISQSLRKRSRVSVEKNGDYKDSTAYMAIRNSLRKAQNELCGLCGLTEIDDISLISCRKCSSSYHTSCMGLDMRKMNSASFNSWLCDSCKKISTVPEMSAPMRRNGWTAAAVIEPPRAEDSVKRDMKFETLYCPDVSAFQIWSQIPVDTARQAASNVIAALRKRDESAVFEHPVSNVDAPEYSNIVARPMCLAWVSESVLKGRYDPPPKGSGVGALAYDLDLIFVNCIQYNEANTSFAALARSFRSELPGLLKHAILETKSKIPQSVRQNSDGTKCLRYDPESDIDYDERYNIEEETSIQESDFPFEISQPFRNFPAEIQHQAYLSLLATLRAADIDMYFEEPVTEEDAPGYADEISNPMCWKIIEERLQRYMYRSRTTGGRGPHALLKDIRLVYHNAKAYNAPGDAVWVAADENIRSFLSKISQVCSEISRVTSADSKLMAVKEIPEPRASSTKKSTRGILEKRTEDKRDEEILAMLAQLSVPETKSLVKRVITKLRDLDKDGVYETAVENERVKKPMSISLMSDRMRKGLYTPCSRWNGISALLSDTKLIFFNAMKSELEGSDAFLSAKNHLANLPHLFADLMKMVKNNLEVPDSVDTEKRTVKKISKELPVMAVPSELKIPKVKIKPVVKSSSGKSASTQPDITVASSRDLLASLDVETLEKVGLSIIQLFRNSDEGEWFEHRVTDTMAPGYSNFIKKPMWLGLIEENLTKNKYRKKGSRELLADFRLIFQNAMSYNMEDSAVYKAAKEADRLLPSIILNAHATVCAETDKFTKKRSRRPTAKLASSGQLNNLLSSLDPIKVVKSSNGWKLDSGEARGDDDSLGENIKICMLPKKQSQEVESSGTESDEEKSDEQSQDRLQRKRKSVSFGSEDEAAPVTLAPSRASKRARKPPVSFDF